MALVKDNSMNSVELFDRGKFNSIENGVNYELKVADGDAASIKVVGCSYWEKSEMLGRIFLRRESASDSDH